MDAQGDVVLNKLLKSILILFLSSSVSYANYYSTDIHKTQIDNKIKNCPKSNDVLAKEVLQLEIAGMRWRNSDPKCFETLKMKYVHAFKVPDAHAQNLIKVTPGSLKILSIKENKTFYSQDIVFTIQDENGKLIKDQMSFMTNAEGGEEKPKRGCVLISAHPKAAFVRKDCL